MFCDYNHYMSFPTIKCISLSLFLSPLKHALAHAHTPPPPRQSIWYYHLFTSITNTVLRWRIFHTFIVPFSFSSTPSFSGLFSQFSLLTILFSLSFPYHQLDPSPSQFSLVSVPYIFILERYGFLSTLEPVFFYSRRISGSCLLFFPVSFFSCVHKNAFFFLHCARDVSNIFITTLGFFSSGM